MFDPLGHEWLLGHEIEKVTPEEMQRRYYGDDDFGIAVGWVQEYP